MYDNISPKYIVRLLNEIEITIMKNEWIGNSLKNIEIYMGKWASKYNFSLKYSIYDSNEVDIIKTLERVDTEILIKIAIDLGIEVPDVIYCIPEIKTVLLTDYTNAFSNFEKAYKNLNEDPATSISQANSSLESIIKHILKDDNVKKDLKEKGIAINEKDTLTNLCKNILKSFNYFPNFPKGEKQNEYIRNIGSGLLTTCEAIENLRSNHTEAHGNNYILNDSLYAKFVINAVSTIGLFFINFYEKKYKQEKNDNTNQTDNISI